MESAASLNRDYIVFIVRNHSISTSAVYPIEMVPWPTLNGARLRDWSVPSRCRSSAPVQFSLWSLRWKWQRSRECLAVEWIMLDGVLLAPRKPDLPVKIFVFGEKGTKLLFRCRISNHSGNAIQIIWVNILSWKHTLRTEPRGELKLRMIS